MNKLGNINNNLFTSIEKLQLINLMKEVELHLVYLKNKCDMQEYFLVSALEGKPFKIFVKKYKKWDNQIKKLKENYERSCNDYIDEFRYYDELVQMFENYNK